MTTHTAHFGANFNSVLGALHLPQRPMGSISPLALRPTAPTDWLERLARWSERQPMHHRMGSYTRSR